jgi:hypothetical protein
MVLVPEDLYSEWTADEFDSSFEEWEKQEEERRQQEEAERQAAAEAEQREYERWLDEIEAERAEIAAQAAAAYEPPPPELWQPEPPPPYENIGWTSWQNQAPTPSIYDARSGGTLTQPTQTMPYDWREQQQAWEQYRDQPKPEPVQQWQPEPEPAPIPPSRPALNPLQDYAWQTATRHGLEPDVFLRQIGQESGWSQDVITGQRRSSAGATGIGQFIPSTASAVANQMNRAGYQTDANRIMTDPQHGLDAAAFHMRDLLTQYGGDYRLALTAYNGGPRAVDALRSGRPFQETRTYLDRILQGRTPEPPPRAEAPPPVVAQNDEGDYVTFGGMRYPVMAQAGGSDWGTDINFGAQGIAEPEPEPFIGPPMPEDFEPVAQPQQGLEILGPPAPPPPEQWPETLGPQVPEDFVFPEPAPQQEIQERGTIPAVNAPGTVGNPDLVPNQYADRTLSASESAAACGPAAAVAFARAMGRNPTLREALDLAKQVNWTPGGGMNGIANQGRLLDRMGIPNRVVVTGERPDEAPIIRDIQGGNPVTISSAGHYFVADAYRDGRYHVGTSGTVVSRYGGSDWMTIGQMNEASRRLAGSGINGVLYLDNPASPVPSVATLEGNTSENREVITGPATREALQGLNLPTRETPAPQVPENEEALYRQWAEDAVSELQGPAEPQTFWDQAGQTLGGAANAVGEAAWNLGSVEVPVPGGQTNLREIVGAAAGPLTGAARAGMAEDVIASETQAEWNALQQAITDYGYEDPRTLAAADAYNAAAAGSRGEDTGFRAAERHPAFGASELATGLASAALAYGVAPSAAAGVTRNVIGLGIDPTNAVGLAGEGAVAGVRGLGALGRAAQMAPTPRVPDIPPAPRQLTQPDIAGLLPPGLPERAERFPHAQPAEPTVPVYFSRLEETLQQRMPERATPDQIEGLLRNSPVKEDERRWSGMDVLLDRARETGAPLQKDDVLEYLRNNAVTVEEVDPRGSAMLDWRGGRGQYGGNAAWSAELPGGQRFDIDQVPSGYVVRSPGGTRDLYPSLEAAQDAAQQTAYNFQPSYEYQSYRLPGGQNYRELLLRTPDVGPDVYTSPHYPQENILAHVRFSDHTAQDGAKVLMIEEIQSDWHQAGRQSGYFDPLDPSQRTPAQFRPTGAVPAAPFSKSWPDLAMNRMVRWASENGYDRIAWTTGDQQYQRYYAGVEDEIMGAGPAGIPDLEESAWRAQTGMRSFYDNILTNTARRIGKAFGATPGETRLAPAIDPLTGQEVTQAVHSMDITPRMRESSLTRGHALYGRADPRFAAELGSAAAGAGASQLGTDENTTLQERLARAALGAAGGYGAARALGRAGRQFEDLADTLGGANRPFRAGLGPMPTEDVPEFAGNILLRKYPEEIQQQILREYDANPQLFEEARRGVIPDDVVRDLSRYSGIDAQRVADRWKPGDAVNAETALALREALGTQARAVQEAQQAFRTADPAAASGDMLRLGEELLRFRGLQEVVSGVTAEAGRALRQFRQPVVGEDPAGVVVRRLDELTRMAGKAGKTDDLARLLRDIDLEDPHAVAGAARALFSPTPKDYFNWYLYFNLLTSPVGRIRDFASSGLALAGSIVEPAAAAPYSKALAVVTRTPQERYAREVPERLIGALTALPDASKQALHILKQGFTEGEIVGRQDMGAVLREPVRLPGRVGPVEIPDDVRGLVPNIHSRLLRANDAFYSTMGRMSELYGEAYRIAKMEGKTGEALAERIADLRANPTEEMIARAMEAGKYHTFQQGGTFVEGFSRLKEQSPGLRVLVPFHQTPWNLTKYMAERSPLALATLPAKIIDMARGTMTQGEFADYMGRLSIGTGILLGVKGMAEQGLITGAPPRNDAERDAFYRQGKQPYSIKVGDEWHSYQWAQPFSALLAGAATAADLAQKGQTQEAQELLGIWVLGLARSVLDQPFTQGLADVLNILERPADQWPKAFQDYAERTPPSMLLPASAFLRFLARASDQVIRDPEGPVEGVLASIPGLTGRVPAKLNAVGQEVQRPEGQRGLRALDITRPSAETTDPAEIELAKLQQWADANRVRGPQPGFPEDRLPQGVEPNRIPREAFRAFQQESGELFRVWLASQLGTPEWERLGPAARIDRINKMRETQREGEKARLELPMRREPGQPWRWMNVQTGKAVESVELEQQITRNYERWRKGEPLTPAQERMRDQYEETDPYGEWANTRREERGEGSRERREFQRTRRERLGGGGE